MPASQILNISRTSPTTRLTTMLALVVLWFLIDTASTTADDPDSIFRKPAALTMSQLASQARPGVSAVEVSDYAPGHYTGELTPSPPHADMNPGKAIVVFWKDQPQRLVFSHEASYCPILELPNGAGMCNQFFEGNIQGTVEKQQW